MTLNVGCFYFFCVKCSEIFHLCQELCIIFFHYYHCDYYYYMSRCIIPIKAYILLLVSETWHVFMSAYSNSMRRI